MGYKLPKGQEGIGSMGFCSEGRLSNLFNGEFFCVFKNIILRSKRAE
jgi:hypothetical protein